MTRSLIVSRRTIWPHHRSDGDICSGHRGVARESHRPYGFIKEAGRGWDLPDVVVDVVGAIVAN